MKKLIFSLLACLMILITSATVFAAEPQTDIQDYKLDELFKDYQGKTLDEMIKFIESNSRVYVFIEFFTDHLYEERVYMINIHTTGQRTSKAFPDLEAVGISKDNCAKYLVSTARVTRPDYSMSYFMLGEIGNRVMTVELNYGFVSYINSIDRVERNKLILNFLMNLINNDEVTGVSFSFDYIIYGDSNGNTNIEETDIVGDCNGDGRINGADAYLMVSAISGKDFGCIDPFAVDIIEDGYLNAKDYYELKRKIAVG